MFKPQFHGREHLNAYLWLMLLQDKQPEVMKAFDKGVISMDIDKGLMPGDMYLLLIMLKMKKERNFVVQSIREGGDLFEQLFGYRSKSMIAPCYIWDDCIEEVAAQVGDSIFTRRNCSDPICIREKFFEISLYGRAK